MPPTAAPIRPPFTLFRLVVAPITAPAAAPIAASRLVCLTVTSALCDEDVPDVVDRLRATSPLDVARRVVRAVEFVAAGVRPFSAFGLFVAAARSAGDRLSSDPRAWAASERSLLSAVSAL